MILISFIKCKRRFFPHFGIIDLYLRDSTDSDENFCAYHASVMEVESVCLGEKITLNTIFASSKFMHMFRTPQWWDFPEISAISSDRKLGRVVAW